MGNVRVVAERYGRPEVLRVVRDAGAPVPGPGQARVRVEASSAVFTDTLIRRGLYPYLADRQPPLTLGYDLVGVVDQVGPGVESLRAGQRVADLTQLGANASYAIRPAAGLVPVPHGLDPAEAETMVLSFLTASQMLTRSAAVRAGQRILVTPGTGAVGHALLQLGRVLGVEVVATASAGKLAGVRAEGATAVDHRAPGADRALRLAAEGGFDAAFDGVGGRSTARSFRLLAPGGVLVSYGAVGPAAGVRARSAVTSAVGTLLFRAAAAQARLRNALPNGRTQRDYEINALRRERPGWFAEDLGALFGLLATRAITPVIDERIPFPDAARAHERIEAGAALGRLVLVHDTTAPA